MRLILYLVIAKLVLYTATVIWSDRAEEIGAASCGWGNSAMSSAA